MRPRASLFLIFTLVLLNVSLSYSSSSSPNTYYSNPNYSSSRRSHNSRRSSKQFRRGSRGRSSQSHKHNNNNNGDNSKSSFSSKNPFRSTYRGSAKPDQNTPNDPPTLPTVPDPTDPNSPKSNANDPSTPPLNPNPPPPQNLYSRLSSKLPSPTLPLPKINLNFSPLTTLKISKRYTPVPKTILTLGADFNTQLGVWQFRSDWEDKVIGGRLSLKNKSLELTKTWLLSLTSASDLVTRLRLRATFDFGTGAFNTRLGFRTERLSSVDLLSGLTLKRRFPLSKDGHAKLEVVGNFCFPEPEIEWGGEKREFVGMGDVEVSVEEINLLMDY
ncbi:hypothetical protein TrVE_jg3575 [Triparma verrucosa]|uniref:Uncharacterized protein n=2 Tax=Triparma TaxID=722752 RepID=A0A9W7A3Z7_9STRA|nr:hypothetical protein TrST_g10136 [Triparma strigata]GMI03687.1 hypothetical protein TrVE_jg3575 [Triparma verrucosa]